MTIVAAYLLPGAATFSSTVLLITASCARTAAGAATSAAQARARTMCSRERGEVIWSCSRSEGQGQRHRPRLLRDDAGGWCRRDFVRDASGAVTGPPRGEHGL